MLLSLISCQGSTEVDKVPATEQVQISESKPIAVAAERTELYLDKLRGKRLALMVNPSSLIQETHLVDSLLALGMDIKKVFAPEHGFRGKADAGELVSDGKDAKTGLVINSLYGKNKKPSPELLADVDLVIFDIQDVGVRFYTYTSSLHYLMEGCSEANVPLMILDRPNPNGRHVQGNIHSLKKTSFVGMHPVPILHGLTIGEYGKMINGEGWLKDGMQCQLDVIPCGNYSKNLTYELPVRPSPNLPNYQSVLLYPSLCLFEGTVLSVGRGTEFPFQVYGHPDLPESKFSFTPAPTFGAKNPKLNGKRCNGYDLRKRPIKELEDNGLNLQMLIAAYEVFPDKDNFFLENGFFDTLVGDESLRKMIIRGLSYEDILVEWNLGIKEFRERRQPYLMY